MTDYQDTSFSLVSQSQSIQEYPYGTESLFRDSIAEVMRAEGWNVKTEVHNEFGIADLVARRGCDVWVIETKISGDIHTIAHACGQLLFYTTDIRYTKRMIAT